MAGVDEAGRGDLCTPRPVKLKMLRPPTLARRARRRPAPKDDDVVDADFEEVDDQNRNKSA